jgi:hypothetical protein
MAHRVSDAICHMQMRRCIDAMNSSFAIHGGHSLYSREHTARVNLMERTPEILGIWDLGVSEPVSRNPRHAIQECMHVFDRPYGVDRVRERGIRESWNQGTRMCLEIGPQVAIAIAIAIGSQRQPRSYPCRKQEITFVTFVDLQKLACFHRC